MNPEATFTSGQWVDGVDRYWYTHGVALKVAVERAGITGLRHRVERVDPRTNPYYCNWQVIPV